jgi:DNA topoisomerase IB
MESAKEAGLRYVTDAQAGIRRRRPGRGFRYIDSDAKPVRDKERLARIRSLVIPPAWQDVWICANPKGHLQVIGRDARSRKQSRYPPRWRSVRDETKYERTTIFGELLPVIRERVSHDLSLPGLPPLKVLAVIVRLMELTLIRVGNEEYARENHSYGLTTMRNKHVQVEGSGITFKFPGKSLGCVSSVFVSARVRITAFTTVSILKCIFRSALTHRSTVISLFSATACLIAKPGSMSCFSVLRLWPPARGSFWVGKVGQTR